MSGFLEDGKTEVWNINTKQRSDKVGFYCRYVNLNKELTHNTISLKNYRFLYQLLH